MGSPLFTMHKLTVLMFLCLASQISARCFLGVCSDKCEDNAPTAGQCAILFDEPKCNEDKFVVPINQGLTVRAIPVSSDLNEDDDDDEFEDEGFDIVDTDDLDDFEESIQCVKC